MTEYRYFLVMTFGKWRRKRPSALVRRWGPVPVEQEQWFAAPKGWAPADRIWATFDRVEHVEKPITARQAARYEVYFTQSFRRLQRRFQGPNPAAPDALFPPDMEFRIRECTITLSGQQED
ncbi:MAG TPA: hypothetical protein VL652_14145 [Kutzneria sp.]|nr:hypothetical protein [Kutzneria sp.]